MNWMRDKSSDSFFTVSSHALRKHRAMLAEEIVEPAADLHMSLRSSVHRYVFVSEPPGSLPGGENEIDESWTRRDLAKWQDMKLADKELRPICSLYPSIVREADGIGPARTICVPTVVVGVAASLATRHPPPAEPDRKTPPQSVRNSTGSKATGWERRREASPDRADIGSSSSRSEASFSSGFGLRRLFGQSSRSHTA